MAIRCTGFRRYPRFQPACFLNATKHKGMKKANVGSEELGAQQVVKAPAFLKLGSEVVRALKDFLDAAERPSGRSLQQKEFGSLIGASKSTIHDWYHGEIPAPIKIMICALERLSERQRVDLLGRICRPCIRLDHPRLAHNTEFIRWLERVSTHPAGLSFLVGPSASLRSFAMAAIGNTAVRSFALDEIGGLDLRIPDEWAPIPGVTYVRRMSNTADIKNVALQLIDSLDQSSANFIVFNSVWELLPELRRRIAELAETRTVIVGDNYASGLEGRKPYLAEANIISLGAGPNERIDLRISIRKENGEKR
jgi:hypothetical protein